MTPAVPVVSGRLAFGGGLPTDKQSASSSPSFTTPDHPAVKFQETLRQSNGVSQDESSSPKNAEPERDPHQQPTFSNAEPSQSILYLPPLISSLPTSIVELPRPSHGNQHPPLATETRLPNIDPVSLSLHKALHYFKPIDDKYASTPYADAFNWSELELPVDEEREWYCVAFRSKRKSGSDGTPLYDADKKAHEEAVQNGGLLMYWYGVPDPQTGLNLATCIWQSRRHAIAANSRPHHIRAMKLAAVSYEIYTLERHVLRKSAGQKNVTIEPYEGGEIGW